MEMSGRTGVAALKMNFARLPVRFSHVGRRPVVFEPSRVTITAVPCTSSRTKNFRQTPIVEQLVAKGQLGQLSFPIHKGLKWALKPGHIESEQWLTVELDRELYDQMTKHNQKYVKAMWGTTASGLNRIVEGVSEGFQVSLRLVGVGYKVALDPARGLVLKLGYSHDVVIAVPAGITTACPSPTRIILSGMDLQRVTQFAALIRSKRRPEPYKGKGVFVSDETIRLKEVKKKQ